MTLERAAQAEHFRRHGLPGGHGGAPYRLPPGKRLLNLAPDIRAATDAYFADKKINWHLHAAHGLSSQVCCLNFLVPLAWQPALLARVVGAALGLEAPEMLPVEKGPDGTDWFVGFEWIGRQDHLNEAGPTGRRSRGANATSADAVVRFRHAGVTETLLIEWKYTESYGAPLANGERDGRRPNEVRAGRYRELVFAPAGPIRADLGLALESFFWEPFYQLLRQQMLACRMEQAREDGAERVRVLHISPRGNGALHRVTSPAFRRFGNDAFEAFAAVLAPPADGVARFTAKSTEEVFGPVLETVSESPWAAYLAGRYDFLRGR